MAVSEVFLIDQMGDCLTVVNAARVSFGKRKIELTKGDEKLIQYLADHNHWSPFAHASLQFHIKAPIFVARQLVKHQVGLVWNEISRRYVDYEPTFFEVEKWRSRAENKKQGSGNYTVEWLDDETTVTSAQRQLEESAVVLYNNMILLGVAPEQARMILPQSMMTEWYWSGTLYAFARMCKLRCASDAQYETREIADKIAYECSRAFPVCWKALWKQNTNF